MPINAQNIKEITHRHQNLLRIRVLEPTLERLADRAPHGRQHDDIVRRLAQDLSRSFDQHLFNSMRTWSRTVPSTIPNRNSGWSPSLCGQQVRVWDCKYLR